MKSKRAGGLGEQLALRLSLRLGATFENYAVGSNAEVVETLQRYCREPARGPFLYLWGAAGVGKTHLLEAACHELALRGETTALVPMRAQAHLSPELLDQLETLSLICLDDVESVAGESKWEQALFHLYNRVQAANTRLIVTAAVPPLGMDVRLEDLRSRLASGLALKVLTVDDTAKLLALKARALGRGLELPDEVGLYVLRHHQRDMRALFDLLERLDEASLAQKRRLSVPLVREVLSSDNSLRR